MATIPTDVIIGGGGTRSVSEKPLHKRFREYFLPDGLLNPIQSAGRCNGCGCFLNGIYEMDHVYPKSRGGTEDVENFQMLCVPCNREKSDSTMVEWLLIPNARCRSFWAGREHLAPLGKANNVDFCLPRNVQEITEHPKIVEIVAKKVRVESYEDPPRRRGRRGGKNGKFFVKGLKKPRRPEPADWQKFDLTFGDPKFNSAFESLKSLKR